MRAVHEQAQALIRREDGPKPRRRCNRLQVRLRSDVGEADEEVADGLAERLRPGGRPLLDGKAKAIVIPAACNPMLGDRGAVRGLVLGDFTGTGLAGTIREPAEVVLVLRGLSQGFPTLRPARELGGARTHSRGFDRFGQEIVPSPSVRRASR